MKIDENEALPDGAIDLLPKRARRAIEYLKMPKTFGGVKALTPKRISLPGTFGPNTIAVLMKFRENCMRGRPLAELRWGRRKARQREFTADTNPEHYSSLSDYVLAIVDNLYDLKERDRRMLSGFFGLMCNEESDVKTLQELANEFSGISREAVRLHALKMQTRIFTPNNIKYFAKFQNCAMAIFRRACFALNEGAFLKALNAAYPQWHGTTEFSALQLLRCCGVDVKKNDSGRIAWMTGGEIERNCEVFFKNVLEDVNRPLDDMTEQVVVANSAALGLGKISRDSYRFMVQMLLDRYSASYGASHFRWWRFLRVRYGKDENATHRRRLAVATVLREAGPAGLSYRELIRACRKFDPKVDIGRISNMAADTSHIYNYDMDGTGAKMIIFDYGDKRRAKRFSLDVFFKDEELVKQVKALGEKLRRHMEDNSIGVAGIVKLHREMQAHLPEKYAKCGIPSACLYTLLREYKVAGLSYYSHPNAAHPDFIRQNDGKIPERAMGWMIYQYFKKAGRDSASFEELYDFCGEILGISPRNALSGAIAEVRGKAVNVDGETRYILKLPDEKAAVPKMMLDCGEVDKTMSFSFPRNNNTMNVDADGRARALNSYVRIFLRSLVKSRYAFSEKEKEELADPAWCKANFGFDHPAFILSKSIDDRPISRKYWLDSYQIGMEKFWVSCIWERQFKTGFDKWAAAIAEKAGFNFVPYDISSAERRESFYPKRTWRKRKGTRRT